MRTFRDFKPAGHWWSKYEPHFPKPVPQDKPWDGQAEFVAALERKQARAAKEQFKGFSICRVCDKINGTTSFRSGGWEWPSGLIHYIVEHNVRPAEEDFIAWVLK